MIDAIVVDGVNSCTADESIREDRSPQLSGTHTRPDAHGFAVVAFDEMTAFTHWGTYDIAAHARGFQPMQVPATPVTATKSSMTSAAGDRGDA
jgi:phosphatidylethanolamine-binding protein (PEBP) family uncharacterized protein